MEEHNRGSKRSGRIIVEVEYSNGHVAEYASKLVENRSSFTPTEHDDARSIARKESDAAARATGLKVVKLTSYEERREVETIERVYTRRTPYEYRDTRW